MPSSRQGSGEAKVYKLDNQELAEKHAGEKVKLTGVLDPKTNIIAVHFIEPVKWLALTTGITLPGR